MTNANLAAASYITSMIGLAVVAIALAFAIVPTTALGAECEHIVQTPNGTQCLDDAMEWIQKHCPDQRGSIHGDEKSMIPDCEYKGNEPEPSEEGSL